MVDVVVLLGFSLLLYSGDGGAYTINFAFSFSIPSSFRFIPQKFAVF